MSHAAKGKVIACLCPGENFSSRWVSTWTMLAGHLIVRYEMAVVPMFDFCTNPYTTRNMMSEMAQALEKLDYVLWLDDDNPLQPESFDRLYRALQRPDAGMVAGWSWCEKDQYPDTGAFLSAGRFHVHPSRSTVKVDDATPRPDLTCIPLDFASEVHGQSELIEVDYSGFPAVLMLGESLRAAGPLAFSPFISPIFEHGYSGEDYAFCRNLRERSGKKIFVDPLCQVPHLKLRPIKPTRLLTITQNEKASAA